MFSFFQRFFKPGEEVTIRRQRLIDLILRMFLVVTVNTRIASMSDAIIQNLQPHDPTTLTRHIVVIQDVSISPLRLIEPSLHDFEKVRRFSTQVSTPAFGEHVGYASCLYEPSKAAESSIGVSASAYLYVSSRVISMVVGKEGLWKPKSTIQVKAGSLRLNSAFGPK